jgi:hypothetical protein
MNGRAGGYPEKLKGSLLHGTMDLVKSSWLHPASNQHRKDQMLGLHFEQFARGRAGDGHELRDYHARLFGLPARPF